MFSFFKRFFGTRQEEIRDPESIAQEFWHADFRKSETARFTDETGESYSAKIGARGLSLSFDKKNVYAWTVNPLYRYRDFVLEALLEFPRGAVAAAALKGADAPPLFQAGTMAAGFLFRYLSETTFYGILVSDRGMVRMDVLVNGTPIPVLGWTETRQASGADRETDEDEENTPYRKNPGVWSVRVIARGTSFTIILNDIWVAECSDDTIQAAGKIAFAGQNWAVNDKAEARVSALALDSRPMEVETIYARWNQYMKITPEAHINLARTWYAMGKYVPAIIELKRAWKNREPGTDELLLSAQVHLAQRLLPEAESQVRKALTLDESHEQASAELGGILYLQNRFVELDDLLKSLSRDTVGRSSFLSNLQGHLLHWKGDHEEAANAYRRAAVLTPDQGLFSLHEGKEWASAGKTAEALEAWLEAARIFLSAEEYGDLEEIIPLLLSIAKDDIRVQAAAGKYYYATGRTSEAQAALEKAISGDTPDSGVWYLHGMILSGDGRTRDAIRAFRKAVSLEEGYGPYNFRLAETLFLAGEGCGEEIARALATGSGNGWAYNLAALKAIRENDFAKAETHIREARRLLGAELPVLVNFAEIMRMQGKLDEVLPLLDTDDSESLRAGANLLVEAKRHEEAEEWYLKALRRRPFDAELLTDRAANCLELDFLNEADDLLGRALDIKPSPRIYRLIGFLALRKGEYSRSEVALQQGLQVFPGDADILYDLTAQYVSTRRLPKAAESLKLLLAREDSERTRALEGDINETGTNKVVCSICGLAWRVPKEITAQGSLHLTAEPPDGLPAGTCPECGDIYCIGCAKETLGEDGRFRCRRCAVPLKLIDPNIIWLLNRWQAAQD